MLQDIAYSFKTKKKKNGIVERVEKQQKRKEAQKNDIKFRDPNLKEMYM